MSNQRQIQQAAKGVVDALVNLATIIAGNNSMPSTSTARARRGVMTSAAPGHAGNKPIIGRRRYRRKNALPAQGNTA